jgi:hypothetical protein
MPARPRLLASIYGIAPIKLVRRVRSRLLASIRGIAFIKLVRRRQAAFAWAVGPPVSSSRAYRGGDGAFRDP